MPNPTWVGYFCVFGRGNGEVHSEHWSASCLYLGQPLYHQRLSDLSAFVLAGGKSTRMGRDKAFLRLGGVTLLETSLNLARSVADDVWILGDSYKFSQYGRVIEDIYPGRGPLGGIHAALTQTKTELNLVIAVDTPFITAKFIDLLISHARDGDAVVTVPRAGGSMHPLCAIYRREFAALSEKALIRGQNRIDMLFVNVRTRVIAEEEVVGMGFFPEMFRNLNTEDDWRQAQAWLKENQKADEVQCDSEQ